MEFTSPSGCSLCCSTLEERSRHGASIMGFHCPWASGKVKRLKRWVVKRIFPIFQEDEEEKWILSWSPQSGAPSRLDKSRRSGRKSWLQQESYTNSRGLRELDDFSKSEV